MTDEIAEVEKLKKRHKQDLADKDQRISQLHKEKAKLEAENVRMSGGDTTRIPLEQYQAVYQDLMKTRENNTTLYLRLQVLEERRTDQALKPEEPDKVKELKVTVENLV